MKENIMKQKYEDYRIFTLSFILFWLLDLLRAYLYADVSLTENMILQEWLLRLLRDVFLAIGISGFIIVGIRELRRNGFGLKKAVPSFLGILMGLGLIFFSWFVEYKIDSFSQSLENRVSLKQDEKNVLSQLTPERLQYIKKKHQQQEKQMIDIRKAKFIWLGLLLGSLMIGLFSPILRTRRDAPSKDSNTIKINI